eukprot:scaffold1224_cov191-Pinguiococcus_pyrenoidosus.AAC.5
MDPSVHAAMVASVAVWLWMNGEQIMERLSVQENPVVGWQHISTCLLTSHDEWVAADVCTAKWNG